VNVGGLSSSGQYRREVLLLSGLSRARFPTPPLATPPQHRSTVLLWIRNFLQSLSNVAFRDATQHYTFKIWAQKYVTSYDVNHQGHTSAEKFCFIYHYYEDNTHQRWACSVGEVPSSTEAAWVWDTVHERYKKLVNGTWQWAPA